MTPTAINIRGTGGSGKSTVVRRVMDAYSDATPGSRHPTYAEGRRQPLTYLLEAAGLPPLTVIGHYETACGGADTVKTVGQVFDLARGALGAGRCVVFEGIMVNDDLRRTAELAADFPTHVTYLNTPLDECLRRIAGRRTARGDPRPLNPKNTTDRYARGARMMARLTAAGVLPPHELDVDGAVAYTLALLREATS